MQERATREKVLLSLRRVMLQDKANHIKYLWGGRTDPEQGFDCSGLIVYTLQQAGISMDQQFTSRTAFRNFPTQGVEMSEDKKIKNNLKNIQEGDLLFWNSIDPEYKRSIGPIPEITKNKKIYRIHHMAFIETINYQQGTIDIIESGSQGVARKTINAYHCLREMGVKNSQLYVAHIDYTTLQQKKLVPR